MLLLLEYWCGDRGAEFALKVPEPLDRDDNGAVNDFPLEEEKQRESGDDDVMMTGNLRCGDTVGKTAVAFERDPVPLLNSEDTLGRSAAKKQ